MAKSAALLVILLVINMMLVSVSIAASISSPFRDQLSFQDHNQESEVSETGDNNQQQESGSRLGAIHARSLPPPPSPYQDASYSSASKIAQNPFPFMSHVSELKNLINASASSDVGISDEVRNQLLKYYFVSDLSRSSSAAAEGGGQQMIHGTIVQSPIEGLKQDSQMLPLTEAEIRRLITRFSGHPIEILLRRALRASKTELSRGRRYKAIPDTSFIRFGRSGHSFDSASGATGYGMDYWMQPQIVKQSDDQMDASPYEAANSMADSLSSTHGSSISSSDQMSVIKKSRPERYYLRFG